MSRLANRLPRFRQVMAICLFLWLAGCASFKPGVIDAIPLHDRASVQTNNGLTVRVAVVSREEAAELFGANLHDGGVQPVWLEIENNSAKPFWLMMHGIDPNYFSAREVAYMNHKSFSGKANREMDSYFSQFAIEQSIPAGAIISGFAFSNEKIGTKEVRVRLYSNKDIREFEFFLSVPGMISEWDRKDLGDLFPKDELVHLETEAELHDAIASLPCCTQRENGSGKGEPLNVVIIGNVESLRAIIKAGWDESVFKNNLQSFFGTSYLYGRRPDLQFEKTRRRVDSINNLRFWVTPYKFKGKALVVGSVKRDIDPNVDEAAIYLLEDLASAGTIKRMGAVTYTDPISKEKPRSTFGNDPYWTIGNRLVLESTDEHTALDQIDIFDWNWRSRGVFNDAGKSDNGKEIP